MLNQVTLAQIATETKVSISTVSRALTHPLRVAVATRERIQMAALRLGYAPNQLARSLRQGDSKTIGLILSDIMVRFHSEVAKGVEDVAQTNGYSTILCNSNEDGNREAQYLELLSGFRVGGVIVEPTELNVASVEALVRAGVQVVEVDRISGATGVTAVLSDNAGGASSAAQHFLNLGHKEFGLVLGNLAFTSSRERRDGFVKTLVSAGIQLEPRRIQNCVNNANGGYRATLELLRVAPQITALFIGNAQTMNGALKAIRELGLRIPQDLSVISFDDTDWATFTDPALTVVAQAAYELGCTAANLIFNPKKRKVEPVVRLPTQLIVRQSTAIPSKTRG
jgi:DNA-binding LacI/PurR family transcriptional regulator